LIAKYEKKLKKLNCLITFIISKQSQKNATAEPDSRANQTNS